MPKIAIISQQDKGVLIDVGGCSTLQEVTQQLISTLQISSEFWAGMNIDLNLGELKLSETEVSQILSIAAEVGIKPHQIFASNAATKEALATHKVLVGTGRPMTLAVGPLATEPLEPAATHAQPDSGNIRDAAGAVPAPAATEVHTASNNDANATCTASGAAVEPDASSTAPAPPAILYLRQTLRSGQSVSHQGHLIIIGDVNPGAEVRADGDITVWGALRGVAHAGLNGNTCAEIRALRLEPIQLRIAHAIARSPDRPHKTTQSRTGPETARVINGTIRITANNPD